MYCSHDSINGILPTLAVVFNSPDVRTVTDTPFVLQQLGFVAVESANDNKRTYLKKKNAVHFTSCNTFYVIGGLLAFGEGKILLCAWVSVCVGGGYGQRFFFLTEWVKWPHGQPKIWRAREGPLSVGNGKAVSAVYTYSAVYVMNDALVNVMSKTDHIEMKTFSESRTRNWCLFTFRNILENWIPVILKRESAIYQINHYPLTKYKLTSHSSVNNGARPACVAGRFLAFSFVFRKKEINNNNLLRYCHLHT